MRIMFLYLALALIINANTQLINVGLLTTKKGIRNSRIWFKSFNNKFSSKLKNIKYKLMNRENKIMNNVFFKEKSLGIITKVAYDILTEVNPQFKKRLHILAKSENIFISFVAFPHKSVSLKTQKTLSSASNAFNNIFGSSKTSSDIGYTLYKLENYSILNTFEDFYNTYKNIVGEKHQ